LYEFLFQNMDNSQIAKLFGLYGKLLELHGDNGFRARNYSNLAFQLKKYPKPLAEIPAESLAGIQGIGNSGANKISEMLSKGTFDDLEKLLAKTPEGLIDLLNVRGIGAKKIRTLWQELEIESIGELLYACQENRLTDLKGFGEKTQQNLIKELEFAQQNQGKMLFVNAEKIAKSLEDVFTQVPGMIKVSISGELRRKLEIISKLEFVIECADLIALKNILSGMGFELVEENEMSLSYLMYHNFNLILHLTEKNNFASTLFMTTGSEAHLEKIQFNGQEESEEAIYCKSGMEFIPPELREGKFEFEPGFSGRLNHLIQYADIKGILHNHSNWSDGVNTLEEMAQKCISMGMEYFGICDHSQSAIYANGLSPERVIAQFEKIDELNTKLAPFKIFKGIESDILNNGDLDYSDEILKQFDLIVASVHSNLKMDKENAMGRLIKAIENPYTTILGHPTGRLLLSRSGYPVDHQKLIDACAANKVVIELNANPHRLDIDWKWIDYAMNKEVMISINPDAHNINGLEDIVYGLNVARKGGLTTAFTLNALPLKSFEQFLKNQKKQIRSV
jgi:DNA polymerase (family X)